MPATTKRDPRAGRRAAVEPNLIITIDERHRRLAVDEIRRLLARVAPAARLTGSPGQGLVGVFTSMDPRVCVAAMRKLFSQEPLAFQHTHRWLPIGEWVQAQANDVARFAHHAMAEIAPDETWGIRAERHSSRQPAQPLVQALARHIDNQNVRLDDPDKTVLLQIVGQRAGLAIVATDQTLNVDQELRRQFVRFEELP